MFNDNKLPAFGAADAGKKMPSGGSRHALGKKANHDDTTHTNWRPDPQE